MSVGSEHYYGWRWAVTGMTRDGEQTRHLHTDEAGRDMEIAAFESRPDITQVTLTEITPDGEVDRGTASKVLSMLERFRKALA